MSEQKIICTLVELGFILRSMTPDELELRMGVESDEADLSGYKEVDACAQLMEYFLEQLGLPVPDHFLCLSAEFADGRESLTKVYGRPFALKPEYLDKVDIVCSGDFLNVMARALHAYLTKNVPLEDSRHHFTILTRMTPEEKRQALCAAHNSPDRVGTYAEARIFSAFEPSWFVEREPRLCSSEALDNSEITF
jgi:hypothetical protein